MDRGRGRSFGRGGGGRGSYRGGNRGGGRGGGVGRPPGLSGKEIGMYYANLSRTRKKEKEKIERAVIELDDGKQHAIASIVDQVEASCSLDNESSHHVDSDQQFSDSIQFLQRDPHLDNRLKEELETKFKDPSYQKLLVSNSIFYTATFIFVDTHKFNNSCQAERQKLPIYAMHDDIMNLIHSNQIVVISGQTGCGKTTQLPQFILDDAICSGNGSLCKIACTQPRRISAISVAERVLDERIEKNQPNPSAGYQIRLENKLPRNQGSMIYCTTGILLRQLQNDPLLSQYSHLIIDEIHERNLMSDFLLIYLKDILSKRPDLKVVLMSATLNAASFSSYFNNCPIVEIPGSLYSVRHYYMEDIISMLGNQKVYFQPKSNTRNSTRGRNRPYRSKESVEDNDWRDFLGFISDEYCLRTAQSVERMVFDDLDFELIEDIITYISDHMEKGAILCFLPGWEDIRKLYERLRLSPYFSSGRYLIIPLHSQLSTVNQRKIFEKPLPSVRKIVIATDIAETSITINDVSFVIDCGKVKEKAYDPTSGLEVLSPVWTSKASAQQRAGRAGRVKAGHCFYLYTQFHKSKMQEFQLPEMLRTPLEEICLQIKKLKLGMIAPFLSKAVDAPDSEAVARAIALLKDLNGLNDDESLTPLGHYLAALPLNPRLGKIIIFGALFSCLYPAVIISAFLGHRDPFVFVMDDREASRRARKSFEHDSISDHLTLFNAFKSWKKAKYNRNDYDFCRSNLLSASGLNMVHKMADQFGDLLHEIGFIDTKDIKANRYNVNSGNSNLVKAILCAGLYPNVIHVEHRQTNNKRPPKLSTRHDRAVFFHPSSVHHNRNFFSSKWLIYHKKMKLDSQIKIFDATMVTPFSLLFFGGDIQVDESENTISIDTWIKFVADAGIAKLMKQLRLQLDNCLKQKIKQPSLQLTASNDQSDPKAKLFQEIINLITREDLSQQVSNSHYTYVYSYSSHLKEMSYKIFVARLVS
ncbi:uncharacterized protein TRIADDRAFT_22905 [Trichoplax adhaerens]|uniref:RNA helicase n=1 Tax=Trichoplax adhaerens TaxID=10228 RepID=B3RR36_TRIAD|nr:hypothetical protein TRIADDRAFT_22905 [Trichoplax adhaerens]EDV26276.1 hypothetical protein TRIADDRAFT_22905 [Trichoplax adhaerens]|eukprot:XP_002110272.1 hypothetical protein TRIADDRAFT_22905 [Trichoplax adhaerens]